MKAMPVDRLPIIMGNGLARLPLTRGQFALIDAADAERVSTHCWYARLDTRSGVYYALRNGSKIAGRREQKSVLLHRFLMDAPPGTEVDHANHETLDNRRENLRVTTHALNQRNRGRANLTSTSGYLGVNLNRRLVTRHWAAWGRLNGRSVWIGHYATEIEAALARDVWARKNFAPEFLTFNFPRPGERGIDTTLREIA